MTDRDAPARSRRGQGAWYISALAYRWSSTSVANQSDEDLFSYLGDRIRSARILDCGCGPGMFTEKLARNGAGFVVAVDANPTMVRQARSRLSAQIDAGRVRVAEAFVDARFFAECTWSPDIIVFKRSLHAPDDQSVGTLRAAVAAVAQNGVVVVIHPERSLRLYSFGKPPCLRPYTPFHLFNRFVSLVAVALRLSSYRIYSAKELVALLQSAADGRKVEMVTTRQSAYNIVAIAVD